MHVYYEDITKKCFFIHVTKSMTARMYVKTLENKEQVFMPRPNSWYMSTLFILVVMET